MLNMHIPTIESYSEIHADWYKGFSTAFNLCQLSNYLLLSYLTSYIETISRPIIEESDEYSRCIKKCKNEAERDDLLRSLDIVDMLQQIAADFAATHQKHKDILFFSGLEVNGYHDKNVNLNLNEIRESTTAKSWNQVIKGLVNIFEFLYLFSVTENHLKKIVSSNNTTGIVGKVLNDKSGIIQHFDEEFKLPRNFMIRLWVFFVDIRNLYAHSFGYINEKDKGSIFENRKAFADAYDKLPIDWHLLDHDMIDDFFSEDRLIVGKMYLISDSEICAFRNFVRIFVPELSKWEKREIEQKKDN